MPHDIARQSQLHLPAENCDLSPSRDRRTKEWVKTSRTKHAHKPEALPSFQQELRCQPLSARGDAARSSEQFPIAERALCRAKVREKHLEPAGSSPAYVLERSHNPGDFCAAGLQDPRRVVVDGKWRVKKFL